MNEYREEIDHICDNMKVGECAAISIGNFEKAYPCGFPSIYKTHEQAFLSSKIGSSFGAWHVEYFHEQGQVRILRCKEGGKRVYVDPDREHLFKRMPDGSLERV